MLLFKPEFRARPTGELLSYGSGDISQLGLGDDENMRERKFPTLIKTFSNADVNPRTLSLARADVHIIISLTQ